MGKSMGELHVPEAAVSTPRSTEQIRLDMRDANDIFVDRALRLAAEQRLAADVPNLLGRVATLEAGLGSWQAIAARRLEAGDAAAARADDLQAMLNNAGRALNVMQGHEIRADIAEAALAESVAREQQLRGRIEEHHYEDGGQCVSCRDELDNPEDWPCPTAAAALAGVPSPAEPPEHCRTCHRPLPHNEAESRACRAEPHDRMTWCEQGCEEPEVHARCHDEDAWSVVTWIKNNGGDARYRPDGSSEYTGPCIIFPKVDGWGYAVPGDTIVIGGEWYQPLDSSPDDKPWRAFSVVTEPRTICDFCGKWRTVDTICACQTGAE